MRMLDTGSGYAFAMSQEHMQIRTGLTGRFSLCFTEQQACVREMTGEVFAISFEEGLQQHGAPEGLDDGAADVTRAAR